MLKKIIAGIVAAVFTVMLAGCSDYVMTEEDLAMQKSIQGYWCADDSMGYNSYDSEGNPTELLVVEFTNDFKYFIHECNFTDDYVMTYDPISYSFENEMFRVDIDGVYQYAKIDVSSDGKIMKWITDDQTDTYNRMDEETARAFGIPEYDSEKWSEKNGETDSSESSAE